MKFDKIKMVTFINGILTPYYVGEYIQMDKTLCRSYSPPNIIEGKNA